MSLLEKYKNQRTELTIRLNILNEMIVDLELEKNPESQQKVVEYNGELPFASISGMVEVKSKHITTNSTSEKRVFNPNNKSTVYIATFLKDGIMSVLLNFNNLLVTEITDKLEEIHPELSTLRRKNPKGLSTRVDKMLRYMEGLGLVKRANNFKRFTRWSHSS